MAEQSKESGFGPFASRMKEELKGYVNARVELLRYQAAEQISITSGKIGALLIQAWIFTVFFLVLMIAISLLIGRYLNDYPMGFLLVSGALLLIAWFIFLFRNRIREGISQRIAAGFLPSDSNRQSTGNPPPSSQV